MTSEFLEYLELTPNSNKKTNSKKFKQLNYNNFYLY